MIQLALGLVRNSDPQTSVRSAARSSEFRASHEAKIFSVIVEWGTQGATYREIAARARLEPVAVARRLKAMERRGLIKRWTNEAGAHEQRNGMCIWRAA